MMRHAAIAHLLLASTLAFLAASCSAAQAPGSQPAVIDQAGLATVQQTDGTQNHYVFADGRSAYVLLSGRRVINTGMGDVVLIGHDESGPFLAAYTHQDGLPTTCYVDNSQGIDRGASIELHGILWAKAAQFVSPLQITSGEVYPSATRFCFSEQGQIWDVIAG